MEHETERPVGHAWSKRRTDWLEIAARYAAGESYGLLALAYAMDRSSIARGLKRYGLLPAERGAHQSVKAHSRGRKAGSKDSYPRIVTHRPHKAKVPKPAKTKAKRGRVRLVWKEEWRGMSKTERLAAQIIEHMMRGDEE